MRKFTITTTFLIIATIIAANALWPDSLLTAFASASVQDTLLKVGSLVLLGVLMTTNPPRAKVLRALMGLVSSALLAIVAVGISNYSIGLLDAALYAEMALILAVEALEYQQKLQSRPRTSYIYRQDA